ncbi:MAG: metallophosphatase family protein [Actinomycetota bacterium]|nr:metallophosphatase family protein [Actinomycetota bacterium]
MDHSRGLRSQAGSLMLAAALGGMVALLGVRFIPATNYDLGPASVATRTTTGVGVTRVAVPPLGTVSASTHASPLVFDIQLSRLDFRALADVLDEGGTDELAVRLEDGLRGLATALAIRLVLGALVIGALTGALLPRRRWSTVVAASAGAVIVTGACVLLSAATFDVDAFEQPKFTGELVRAPQVMEAVDRGVESFEELRSRYETGADRLSQLLALVAQPDASPSEESVSILHVSDIHSNPLGVEVTTQLARRFDVEAVIDTGDLTSFGEAIEGRIGALIGSIRVPYLFVPGNHDSFSNRSQLDDFVNVELLDETVTEVEDVSVLGWADPTFTASNETSTEEGNEIRAEEAQAVAAAVDRESPGILAVHDARLAEASVGSVPLVLAGHTHERAIEERDGTIVLTVGSTGATGLGSFVAETELPFEAEIVYFRLGAPVAVDYVRFRGAGSEFEIERSTLETPPEG